MHVAILAGHLQIVGAGLHRAGREAHAHARARRRGSRLELARRARREARRCARRRARAPTRGSRERASSSNRCRRGRDGDHRRHGGRLAGPRGGSPRAHAGRCRGGLRAERRSAATARRRCEGAVAGTEEFAAWFLRTRREKSSARRARKIFLRRIAPRCRRSSSSSSRNPPPSHALRRALPTRVRPRTMATAVANARDASRPETEKVRVLRAE